MGIIWYYVTLYWPRSMQAPKRFLPEPFSSAVYSMEAKAAGMESREALVGVWGV